MRIFNKKILYIFSIILFLLMVLNIKPYSKTFEIEKSNNLESPNEVTSLDTPDGLGWKEGSTATATWNAVENANYYNILVYLYNENGELLDSRITGTSNNELDLQQEINDINNNYKLNKFLVSFFVQAVYIDDIINHVGNYSAESSKYTIEKKGTIKLPTPTNITIDDNYNATWDISDISNIQYFNLYCKIKYENYYSNGYLGLFDPKVTPSQSPEFGITVKNGKASVNLKDKISQLYRRLGYNGEVMEISFYVVSTPENNSTMYLESDSSEYSKSIFYTSAGSTVINNITLSPNSPVIAVGRSIYIGKTIEPNDAIYDSIRWNTSNNNIVSINNMGKITGVSKGNATITAQINNATQTAEVNVYEIETNIEDNNSSEIVMDTANDIIESIISDSDTTGTDITDVSTAQDEIETGAQNGNKFSVDIKSIEKDSTKYNSIKNLIKSFHSDMNIAGGYDVNIEISHKDSKNNKHHIGNITNFDNNVKFSLDILSSIPKLSSTKTREYKLMRYHNNVLEDIDINVKNNKIETSSNEFSDFILLYKDTDIVANGITVSKETIEINKGSSIELDVNVLPLNAVNRSYTSISNNNTIATVQQNKITGINVGTTKVIFTSVDGNFSKEVNVKVVNKLESINLNKKEELLNVGQSKTLNIEYNPIDTTDDKTIIWTSSNPSVAKVVNGRVTAYNVGTTTITAQTNLGISTTCKVTVVNPSTSISYTTHVQSIGWQDYVYNGEMSGTSGKGLRLEAIKIKLSKQLYPGDIEYRTHVQNSGWEAKFKKNNEISGTSGKGLRLEAIEIKLTGEIAKYYDIYYRVHAQHFGWLGWARNGESSGTKGYGYRLEGIEIKLVEKGKTFSEYGKKEKFQDKTKLTPSISYTTHVQSIGWQKYVKDGAMAGTSGKGLRLEGIKIKLGNQPYNGDIEYRTHIQNIGWEKSFKKNDEVSGTSGKGLRLEAIQIKLTGTISKYYDVYYRVHAQHFGWLGWAKNGENAGTQGYGYRLEGIEIKLVKKGTTFSEYGKKQPFSKK